MRILVVAQDFPWPTDHGPRIRLANVVRALGQLGDVDLFTFLWPGGEYGSPETRVVTRWRIVERPSAQRTSVDRLRWLARGRIPSDFLGRDFESVQAIFRQWAERRYDLVWFSRIEPYMALGSLVEGPTILDIDDLADWRLRTRIVGQDGPPPRTARRSVRGVLRSVKDRKDILLWERLQRGLAGSVETAVVCSELDRERVGMPNVVVVPNGFDAPTRPAGCPAVRRPPTILLAGRFGYEANLDGAGYLVREIAPLLRERIGDAQIRLVGKAVTSVRELADPPRVVVTDAVPDMEPELRRADVVAVPIRIGTGTRIKILEAFAHKIPVVSTSLGAEGLDVTNERHLLIADTRQDFVASSARILGDARLRLSLVNEAHDLFLRKYQWAHIRQEITEVARDLSRGRPEGPARAAWDASDGRHAGSRPGAAI